MVKPRMHAILIRIVRSDCKVHGPFHLRPIVFDEVFPGRELMSAVDAKDGSVVPVHGTVSHRPLPRRNKTVFRHSAQVLLPQDSIQLGEEPGMALCVVEDVIYVTKPLLFI